MEQVRFTQEEHEALRRELAFQLFTQRGLPQQSTVGIERDLSRFIENLMTVKIYGQTPAQARKI